MQHDDSSDPRRRIHVRSFAPRWEAAAATEINLQHPSGGGRLTEVANLG
jgi:hypothetical protein